MPKYTLKIQKQEHGEWMVTEHSTELIHPLI